MIAKTDKELLMTAQINKLFCPACGAPVPISATKCEFCHGPIFISTFRRVSDMLPDEISKYAAAYKKTLASGTEKPELSNSLAMCYLKLRLYAKALQYFELAISENIDNSECYFYAAICLLGGKKAFMATRETIDKIEEYVNSAIMIEPRGIYHYFLAYIKYDYFFRKHFKTSPTYGELLRVASAAGYNKEDVAQLFMILAVEKPSEL